MKAILSLLVAMFPNPVKPKYPTDDGQLSPHFHEDEFRCRHCGELHPSGDKPTQQMIDWLENIRAHFGGKTVSINSGYRCPTHNKNVGGATNSQHLEGNATDFFISGVSPAAVYEYCDGLIGDSGGVGKYSGFTHIDNRGYKARW